MENPTGHQTAVWTGYTPVLVLVPGKEDSTVVEHSGLGKHMANHLCVSEHGQNYTAPSILGNLLSEQV